MKYFIIIRFVDALENNHKYNFPLRTLKMIV